MMDIDDTKKSFLDIYGELSEPIFRHCFIRISDREKAKDLTQETFIKYWRYLEKGGQVKNAKAFIYRVANNLIIDDFRKKKAGSLDEMTEIGFEVAGDDAQSVKYGSEVRMALEKVRTIEPKYREVLLMRFVDDMTIGEIAGILNESENSISVRIHRGINKIKELLTGQNE